MCVDRSCEQAEKVLKAFGQRHLVLTSKIKAINTDGYIQLGAAHKEEGSSQPITTAAEDRPGQALAPPEFLLQPGTVPLRLQKSSDSSFPLKRGGFQVSPSFFRVRRQSGTSGDSSPRFHRLVLKVSLLPPAGRRGNHDSSETVEDGETPATSNSGGPVQTRRKELLVCLLIPLDFRDL